MRESLFDRTDIHSDVSIPTNIWASAEYFEKPKSRKMSIKQGAWIWVRRTWVVTNGFLDRICVWMRNAEPAETQTLLNHVANRGRSNKRKKQKKWLAWLRRRDRKPRMWWMLGCEWNTWPVVFLRQSSAECALRLLMVWDWLPSQSPSLVWCCRDSPLSDHQNSRLSCLRESTIREDEWRREGKRRKDMK